MGTLHNAIIDINQQPLQGSSSSQTSSHKDRDTEHRLASNQPPAVRFVPRTTHLESRKRKMAEAAEPSLTDVPRSNEPLIGPKLPEPAQLDMEDVSLNTTVSLIRNTMKQVGCKFRIKQILRRTPNPLIRLTRVICVMFFRWNLYPTLNQ